MTTSSQTADFIARYALTPGAGVGPLRFGDPITAHPELVARKLEPDYPFDPETDYAEYTIPGLDEVLVVYVDGDDCIDSVGFYEFCQVDSRDLIGMGVGELLVLLGPPSELEAEIVGRDVELIYAYTALGLTIWTVEGEVSVVVAGAGEEPDADE